MLSLMPQEFSFYLILYKVVYFCEQFGKKPVLLNWYKR